MTIVEEVSSEYSDKDGKPSTYLKCGLRFDKDAWESLQKYMNKRDDGRIYLNFLISRRSEPGKYGETHKAYIKRSVPVDQPEDGDDNVEVKDSNEQLIEEVGL